MLKKEDLIQLMKTVAMADKRAATAFSYNDKSYSYSVLNDTLVKELNQLVGTNELWRENKNTFFTIVEQSLTDVLPAKVLSRFGDFAEIVTFPQGTKPVFKRKLGRMRAKQFITRVGLAGVYEIFKLGEETFEVPTSAIGGAVGIGFEEFLDGRVDFNELMNILIEGYEELIYKEIAAALIGAINNLPTANRATGAGFDEGEFDRLVQTAGAYGTPTIYCTRDFAVDIHPNVNWASDAAKDTLWNNGYLMNYKGVRVVILPQSFEDETNAKKVIDPGFAWIMVGNERPVKVAFEGQMHVKERENDDWSRDVQTYRKVGVAVLMTNNICVYTNTALAGKLDNKIDGD